MLLHEYSYSGVLVLRTRTAVPGTEYDMGYEYGVQSKPVSTLLWEQKLYTSHIRTDTENVLPYSVRTDPKTKRVGVSVPDFYFNFQGDSLGIEVGTY